LIDILRFLFYKSGSRILRFLETSEVKAALLRLRKDGHSIHPSVQIDRNVRLRVSKNGRLAIEEGVRILQDSWIIVEDGDYMFLGRNVFISQHCTLSGSVTVGRDSLVAGFVTIVDATHVFDESKVPISQQGGRKKPVTIGEDVWIGTSSVILQGVNIGDHAVIGSNSTVTKDIPPWAIAVGSPAEVLRYRKQ